MTRLASFYFAVFSGAPVERITPVPCHGITAPVAELVHSSHPCYRGHSFGFFASDARAPPRRYHPYTIPSIRQGRVAKKIPGMNDSITSSWRDEGRIQVPLILIGILMAIYISERGHCPAEKKSCILVAEQFNILREVIHPQSYLPWEVKGRSDTFLDDYPLSSYDEII